MRSLSLFTVASVLIPISFAADLTRATVVAPASLSGPEKKAVELLIKSVEQRTRIRWTQSTTAPQGQAAISVSRASGSARLPAEGYQLRSNGNRVEVIGNDERGVLFGIGRLLRTLEMRRDSITLPRDVNITTAPKYKLRGHQLGYRPKTNAYDAWDVAMWESYIGDLAVFGANAIELMPPRTDDDADSPHFPVQQMQMMIEMSRIAKEFGLQVWVWYPAMDKDYSNQTTVDAAIKEWAEVLRQLPRVDAVFVPGGDPGHTQPKYLFGLLEKQTASLKKYHPNVQMWMSPQGFNVPWMEEFFGLMQKEPAWLSGIVFGPQVRVNLPELRQRIPKRYPIRSYPDITHTTNAQYAMHAWDVAFAATQDREVINPRPVDEAKIFRVLQPFADAGFLSYSEGCNDDVNKAVWSALSWDPDGDVTEALRDYGRYFIGPDMASAFAQGLLALEENWRGPLLANTGVDTTLAQFRQMERQATSQQRGNWRFLMALYRAYYDAYVRARLISETAAQQQALERLDGAQRTGSLAAMDTAEAALKIDPAYGAGLPLRARVFELAEGLYQAVRMQLSTPRYLAIDPGRGANLDLIDRPITDAPWLRARFAQIRAMGEEADRLAAIREIVEWTSPGPGGFYDDLGDPLRRPHLDPGVGFEKDPAFFHTPRTGFGRRGRTPWRMAWHRYAETLYGNPLKLTYTGLDPNMRYKVRFIQPGDPIARQTRLVANGSVEVYPWTKKSLEVKPIEFEIPQPATAGGKLTLEWQAHPDEPGNGRFIQIGEVWLIPMK